MTTAAQYKKHTHREHILELPDTYIGSVETSLENRWIWDEATGGMTWRAVQFCPGFHKIFDEVLVNALDHRVRMTGRTGADCVQVKHVDVTLTPTMITVRNDGDGIPVEMHPDTGIWAPELIFGNLLTSSNYDKSEEKIVGGKNGYGGKCIRHDTPVLLWNSTVKPAESIEIGDQLIGDDGTLRNVLSVITGSGQLYRVHQAHGESYVVNDAHTLTMCMPDHKVIFWNTSKNGWSMLWWDNVSKSISAKSISASKPPTVKCEECGNMIASNMPRHYRRMHDNKPIPVKERSSPVITPEDSEEIRNARIEMETFASTIPDNNVFDITIGEYMKLNETTKKRLAGMRGKCVDWKKQDVELDPYVLGLWLGDGYKSGYAYACFGEKDPELIKYLEEWGTKNDATLTKVAKYTYRFTSTSNKGKKGCAPLRNILAKYNLVNNKHIPLQYLHNDRDTRLKVLAGIIDTDGHVMRNGTHVSITQGYVHETLAKQIVYLARSLGFAVAVTERDCKYMHKGEKRTSRAYYINISGEHLDDIPTLLPRKKCNGTVKRATDTHTGFLTVEYAGVGKYVGIHIDGNERFLINDFTVTHNCTNIFSNEFTIETVDHRQKKKYVQTWTSNMSIVGKPKITSSSVKPYTEIRFMPDLARFSWGGPQPTEIPADMLAVLATRVIDAAACAGKDCKVSLNGKLVTSNTFPKYIGLYLKDDNGSVTTGESVAGSDDGAESVGGSEDGAAVAVGGAGAGGPAKKTRAPPAPKRVAFETAGVRWEIGAILTRDLHGDAPPDERHISFVNGIATRRGGKHVEYISKKILGDFCELAKKKAKIDITPTLLKDSVVWFINATIVNPSFDTQTKETLTTPASKFGSTPEITPKFCDQLIKIGLLNEAQCLLDAKISRDAKRTDGRKKSTVRGIPKLDDAEWAGTPKSTECTLILTEGDSAKTLAIAGLAVVGRQKYGVFPLKGKILNVKDISADKKLKNQELTYIKQILGLETGKVYTDVKQLRYGKLMIMTDQDVDGSHIKGLLMNLFHTDWPSLLKLGFLCCLMTPLLKATKGRETHNFYSASEFEEWKAGLGDDSSSRGWKIKYYKGLGTSTAAEGREYFESMNSINYVWNDDSDSAIDLAFNKKRADDRKEWLATFDRGRHLEVKSGGASVDYSRFVHDELIHFSNYDNIRSLPHVMDGLKPSQRKIFWAALKKNLTSEIKVAQLAGYVSEVAAYHHGEASLNGAIVNMAQNYVGSNNLNLLVPNGQFGTRLMGGEDSAAPRYIFTELNKMVRSVVKKEDDPILTYTEDDGQMVEPETYLPVIPLLLVNGSLGIGTGFSTNVLPYNPVDIVAALKLRLSGGTADLAPMDLTPWWFGFRGSTTRSADGKTFTTKGIYEFMSDDACTVRITELPVGCWTQDYKDFLEEMLVAQEKGGAGKKDKDGEKEFALRSYTAAYNDVQVDFTLHLDPDYYHTARSYISEFESKFKLCTTHKTTNMVAFDVTGKIRKFMNTGEILETFYKARLAGYTQRRLKELERLGAEIKECNARLVFVRAVVEKRLVIANADDDVLLAHMRALDLPALSGGEGLKGYEYLLRMRIDRLKAAAVAELESEHANLMRVRAALEATTAEQLWLSDLDEFSAAWTTYTSDRTAAYDVSATAAVKPSKARGGAAAGASKKPRAAPRKPAVSKSVVVKNTIVM